jgi:hypothetical protein
MSIVEYIAGKQADAQSPTDAKQALAADHVEAWVRANFDPSVPKVDCPTTGGTCPSRNAKASGSPLCPYVCTLDHLMEAYITEATEKPAPVTLATFLFAITRYVPVDKRQDRHINTRCAVCLKRKPERRQPGCQRRRVHRLGRQRRVSRRARLDVAGRGAGRLCEQQGRQL